MQTAIYRCSAFGVELDYIISENGSFLYRQKRQISAKTWQDWIIRGLNRAGFGVDDIVRIVREVSNRNWFYNREFYKPPRDIVQRYIELSC